MQAAGRTNVEEVSNNPLEERGRIFYVFTPERLDLNGTDYRVFAGPFQVLEPFQFVQIVDLPERRLTERVVEMEYSDPTIAMRMSKRPDGGLEFAVKNAWRCCLDLVENYGMRGVIVVEALTDMKNVAEVEQIERAVIPQIIGDAAEARLADLVDEMHVLSADVPKHLHAKALDALEQVRSALEQAVEYRTQVVEEINTEVLQRRTAGGKGRGHFTPREKAYAKSVGLILTDTTVVKPENDAESVARVAAEAAARAVESQAGALRQNIVVDVAQVVAEVTARMQQQPQPTKTEEKKPGGK